jgi:hypothetical protein
VVEALRVVDEATVPKKVRGALPAIAVADATPERDIARAAADRKRGMRRIDV